MIDPALAFAMAEQAFQSANARPGPEAYFRIAGKVMALKFADVALAAKLLPAFAHLEALEQTPADLTICCWDDFSSGVEMPEWTGEAGVYGLQYIDGPVRMAWEIEQRSLQAYDPSRRLALFHASNVSELASWEQGAPFRQILHWWSAGLGLQLVHGAAVGTEAGGVLLIGRSGAGKSTQALACVGSPLGYAADDYCLLEIGPAPRVHSLYGSGKADAASIAMLPRLAEAFRASPIDQQGKSIIFIAEHAPEAMLRSFPLRAIVLPEIISGSSCRAEVLSTGEALRAVAPSTLLQLPGDRAQSLARLSSLVRRLPCWRLYVGDNPRAAQPLLEAIIAREPAHREICELGDGHDK
jgi:hypothetical protein